MDTKNIDGITILTNPTTEEMGICLRRPFKSEAAALRKARKIGSTRIAFVPADNYTCVEDCWYVADPDHKDW